MRGRGGEGNVWAENGLVVHSLHPIYRVIWGYYWNNGQKGPSRGFAFNSRLLQLEKICVQATSADTKC